MDGPGQTPDGGEGDDGGGVAPAASIVVPCCNQVGFTRLCLESVVRSTQLPYELLLVDNGSGDGTAGFLAEFGRRPGPDRVEVIGNPTNRGFAAGCNQGIVRARGASIVLLNNDTIVNEGWLDGLTAGLERGEGEGGTV